MMVIMKLFVVGAADLEFASLNSIFPFLHPSLLLLCYNQSSPSSAILSAAHRHPTLYRIIITLYGYF